MRWFSVFLLTVFPALAQEGADTASPVAGIVIGPNGAPESGVQVDLRRVLSPWPDFNTRKIGGTLTGEDGRFVFREPRGPDLRIVAKKAGFAKTEVEASPIDPEVTVRLQRGFAVEGIVELPGGGRGVSDCFVILEPGPFATHRASTTRTDSAGRFSFRDVPAAGARLVARHPDFRPASIPSVEVGATKVHLLRFRESSLVLRGQVVSAGVDGEPIKEARVWALPLTSNGELLVPFAAETDERGRFVLDGLGLGNMLIQVRHPKYSTKVRPVSISGENPELSFELVPRSTVRGRLTAGQAVEGVRIELVQKGEPTLRTRVGADGEFVFEGDMSAGGAELVLPDGEFCFAQSASRWVGVQVEEDGETELEEALVAPSAVRGTVLDETGAPVAGVRVFWLSPTSGSLGIPLVGVTDDRGVYEVRGLPRGFVAGFGVTSFVYRRAGYAVVEKSFSGAQPGETVELDPVTLQPPGSIEGKVTRGGRGISGAVVYTGNPLRSTQRVVTAVDGSYVLRDLPAGRYRVKASHATMPLVVSDRAIEVRAGDRAGPVELKLPPGRTLSGVIVTPDGAPIANALIVVHGLRGVAFYSGADGQFNLEAPKGDVELDVFASEELSVFKKVTVPGNQDRIEIEMPMVPWGTVEARVLGLPGRLPMSGGVLRVQSLDGETSDPVRDRQRNITSRWVELNNGDLRVLRFPAGRSRLVLQCPGYAPWVQDVSVSRDSTQVLGEQLLEPGAHVRGVVRSTDGEPLEGARVLLGHELDLGQPVLARATVTDRDGAFTIHGVSAHSGDLIVRAEGFATLVHQIRVPGDLLRDDPLPLVLRPGSTISVCVSQQGSQRDMHIVVLRRSGGIVDGKRTEENGCAVFEHRSIGSYEVEVLGFDTPPRKVEITEDLKTYDVVIEAARR